MNIHTTLMSQRVIYSPSLETGEIVAVYLDRGTILFGLLLDNAKLKFGVNPDHVIMDKAFHELVIHWHPEQKIKCIKMVREMTGLGLKEAKDLVELHLDGVPIGKYNTAQLNDWKKQVINCGLECSSRPCRKDK